MCLIMDMKIVCSGSIISETFYDTFQWTFDLNIISLAELKLKSCHDIFEIMKYAPKVTFTLILIVYLDQSQATLKLSI